MKQNKIKINLFSWEYFLLHSYVSSSAYDEIVNAQSLKIKNIRITQMYQTDPLSFLPDLGMEEENKKGGVVYMPRCFTLSQHLSLNFSFHPALL